MMRTRSARSLEGVGQFGLVALILLLAFAAIPALAQDGAPDDDLDLPDLPGGIDIEDAEAVSARIERLTYDRDQSTGDTRKITAINAQITALEQVARFLKNVATDNEDSINYPEGALEAARAAEAAAREALEKPDAARIAEARRGLAALRSRRDAEEIRQRIASQYTAPLQEARAKAQKAQELKIRREGDLQKFPERKRAAAEKFALAAAKVRELTAANQEPASEREAIYLRWELEAAQQSALVQQRRIKYLSEREAPLARAVEIARLEASTARLNEARLEKLSQDAQKVLEERIAADKQGADARISEKEAERDAEKEEHVRLRLDLELSNERLKKGLGVLLESDAEIRKAGEAITGDLGTAQTDLLAFRASYEPGAADADRPDSARVAELIQKLSEQTELGAHLSWWKEQEERKTDFEKQLSKKKAELADFKAGSEERIAAAEAAYRSALANRDPGQPAPTPWNVEERPFTQALTDHEELLGQSIDALERIVTGLGSMIREGRDLHSIRRETLLLLRRENLFLRGTSQITWGIFSAVGQDLAKLPAYAANAAKAAASYLLASENRERLLLIGGLALLLAAGAIYARRRLRARILALAAVEAGLDGVRTRIAVYRILASLCLALLILGVAAGAFFLLPQPRAFPGVLGLVLGLGLVLAGFVLLRSMNRVIVGGDSPAGKVLKIEDATARRLGIGIALAIWLSVVLLPVRLILEKLGYPNEGVLEFLSLAHKILIGLIAFFILLRRRLVLGLFPESPSRFTRLLRLLAVILHPIVVLLIPGILLLQVLGYDILAGFIAAVAVRSVAFAVLGYLTYRGAKHVLDTRLPKDSNLGPMLLFALRLSVFILTVWAVLAFSGTSLAELESFFSVALPFTPDDDPSPVTWWNLFVAVTILYLTFAAARYLKLALQEFVLSRTSLDRGLQYTIDTLFGYVVVVGGVLTAVRQIFDLSSLAYVVAALSVGIGFGLQEIVSNFISGIILLFERSLKVGDMIRVGDAEGVVTQIQVRSTSVRTQDNVYIIIPNRDFMTQNMVNLAGKDVKLRLRLPVGVSYASDPEQVKEVLLKVAGGFPGMLRYPSPDVYFTGLGDSSLDFELLGWIANPVDKNKIRSQLYFKIFGALKEAGIEIPFPQRDLHLRSAEPLRLASAPPPAEEENGDEEPPPETDPTA